MKTALKLTIFLLLFASLPAMGQQQQEPSQPFKINWQEGPGSGSLADQAEVRIPEGFVFAGGADTRLLMEMMHNPVTGTELGFLAPADTKWFLVFEYDDVGYIKDDEKDTLDADAMLKSIQKSNEEGNKERVKRGWAPLTVTGWTQPPRYNPATHNLEWAINAESEGRQIVNWNTRLLGRGGVMRVTLVTEPEALQQTLPQFQTLIAGFDYKPGKRYAEYRQGDKMAKYGLSALVVGGAAAVAAKTGLLKHLWKLIVVGLLAVAAFVKKLLGRNKEKDISVQNE